MKKFFPLLILIAVIAGSCTKEYQNPTPKVVDNNNTTSGGTTSGGGSTTGSASTTGGSTTGGSGVAEVPTTFSQKALVEEFTGAWCGYCPDGALIMEDIVNQSGGKIIGASWHEGDPLQVTPFSTMDATYGPISSYPSGMVNRVPFAGALLMDRNYWGSAANTATSQTASCGLAITSYVSAGNVSVTVHCGFNQTLSGDYRVSIYLTENGVTGVPQHNYYDDGSLDPNSPLVGLGDPIDDYAHSHVIREAISADLGDPIPADKLVTGGEYVVTKSGSIDGYNINNLRIVAFINRIGTDAMSHQIMNVQEAKIYEIKNWD